MSTFFDLYEVNKEALYSDLVKYSKDEIIEFFVNAFVLSYFLVSSNDAFDNSNPTSSPTSGSPDDGYMYHCNRCNDSTFFSQGLMQQQFLDLCIKSDCLYQSLLDHAGLTLDQLNELKCGQDEESSAATDPLECSMYETVSDDEDDIPEEGNPHPTLADVSSDQED